MTGMAQNAYRCGISIKAGRMRKPYDSRNIEAVKEDK
jgi:hypothetical protein